MSSTVPRMPIACSLDSQSPAGTIVSSILAMSRTVYHICAGSNGGSDETNMAVFQEYAASMEVEWRL